MAVGTEDHVFPDRVAIRVAWVQWLSSIGRDGTGLNEVSEVALMRLLRATATASIGKNDKWGVIGYFGIDKGMFLVFVVFMDDKGSAVETRTVEVGCSGHESQEKGVAFDIIEFGIVVDWQRLVCRLEA